MNNFNIICFTDGNDSPPFARQRYFIDCPIDDFDYIEGVDGIRPTEKIKRLEIPRELANYVNRLQEENARLKAKTDD